MDPMLSTPRAGRSASSSDRSISSSTEPRPRAPLTAANLRAWLAERGVPPYRSQQVLRWVFQRGASRFEEMTDLPLSLREALDRDFEVPSLPDPEIHSAADGTEKLLFRLEAGRAIETVLIPDGERLTVCVSSQAGCAMGCEFCATARLGLQRQLSAAEIVAQVLWARRRIGEESRLTNLVFMGMGEPLANYDALVEAVRILGAPWGLHFSTRRITVSTVGLVPQLERLVRETAVNIAVSLTATTDELRDRLMPVNRRYPLAHLIQACRALPIAQRRRITFEYVLLHGVNDDAADATRLVRLLHGVRAKVNLIPFNPFPESGFTRPPDEAVRAFQERLLAAGLAATVRTSRGRDIAAACGQLAARVQS
jgi:23S rRNA (adenine2503-C2)-methyltransferase